MNKLSTNDITLGYSVIVKLTCVAMIPIHNKLRWFIITFMFYQMVDAFLPLKIQKRDIEEVEEMSFESQVNPPVVANSFPNIYEIFNALLIPFHYFSEILQKIIYGFAQIGQNITTSINDKFSEIIKPK